VEFATTHGATIAGTILNLHAVHTIEARFIIAELLEAFKGEVLNCLTTTGLPKKAT